MFTTTAGTDSTGVEPCFQDCKTISSRLQIEQCCKASEPTQTKQLFGAQQKCCDVSHPAVVNEMIQGNDAEINSDIDDMYMIVQASGESKPEFDSFYPLVHWQGTLDPIRRKTSTGPPAAIKPKKTFLRARTMP